MELRYRVMRKFKTYGGTKVEPWSYHDTWAKAAWTQKWCDKNTGEVKWVQRKNDECAWINWNWPREHDVIGCCKPHKSQGGVEEMEGLKEPDFK